VDRWCRQRDLESGAVLPAEQCWRLARTWYAGRLDPEWERPSVERMEAIFAEVGLGGPFWRLGEPEHLNR
jgi:hypothetical protein